MSLKFSKNNAMIVWVICALLLIPTGILIHSVNAQIYKQSASLTHTAPIQINSNIDFSINNGVSGGNGSSENPWIIDNLNITDTVLIQNYVRVNIYIQDTLDYFIIENCRLNSNYTAVVGIHLENVSNGVIINNTIETCYDSGIVFHHSNNIQIYNNMINNNKEGILLASSSEIHISNNSFTSNQDVDISTVGSNNVTFSGNYFEIGISIDGAEPYIPGNPPTPSNQIYVWIAIIVVLVVSIFLLVSNMRRNRRNK